MHLAAPSLICEDVQVRVCGGSAAEKAIEECEAIDEWGEERALVVGKVGILFRADSDGTVLVAFIEDVAE